ncbi:10776_t:CDS:2 [Cetraspora pellucida]|uniref:10776_t:CDS:1 n=1 Tax=Cetraspora pellucida TaxID=1433469 RepID=A0A9N9IWP8_9GLOM|nr:10776_t:CDS:2 [Cetraspora pellucida]
MVDFYTGVNVYNLNIDIDTIFDIEEDEGSDMDISDQELDDTLNMIMNATDGVGEE